MLAKTALAALLLVFLGGGQSWAAQTSVQGASREKSFLESGLELDRIDIIGVKAFTNSVIEGLIETAPGDRLEKLKVVRTEENLQSLYLSRGYEEVRIRSRLVRKRDQKGSLETVLEFDVTEGKPTRVKSIRLVPEGLSDDVSRKAWEQRERKLKVALKFLEGEILDQDRISQRKRTIQDLLASEEYIGAKTDDIRIIPESFPNSLNSEVYPEGVARWVTVEFHVDMGEKVSFGFRGNSVFTRGYLDNLIDEQRTIGLGKDYLGAIRSRIEEEYRSAGYAQVELTPYTMEGSSRDGRRVTYVINEGPLVRIDSVGFDGNIMFSSQWLQDAYFARAPALVKNRIYVEKEVQKAAELLIERIKEEGYLTARLITVNTLFLPKPRTQINSSTRLMIYVYEGDQTLVDSVSVKGAKLLTGAEVAKILRTEEKKPLNLFAFSEGLENLKRQYRNKGYLGFRILNEGTDELVKYKQENHLADIALDIEEGIQFRVSKIEIEGLVKTKEKVVQRALTFKIGEILTELDMTESERRLRRLSIFSTVAIQPIDDPSAPGKKIVRVVLNEGDRGILTGGPGLRNDLGIRLFGQLAYTNLWGLDHTAAVSASVNRRFYLYNFGEAQLQVSYVWPWFAVSDLTFHPAITVGRTQYINFAADTLITSLGWDKHLLTNPNILGSFTYSLEKIHQFNAVETADIGQFLIGSITPRVSLDLRDSPLAPTSGFYTTAWMDYASALLGSGPESGFYRIQFRADYHIPITRDIVWYLSFRTGYEKNTNETSSIPLIKQFALGGIGSLRGYQEQELNYQTFTVTNSLSYVNYRTQVDLPFAGALKFGVFADAATLLVDNYSFGGLRYGTGFGFHYQTPVGPVNLDWGFKLDPPPKSDAYVVHFSVGVI